MGVLAHFIQLNQLVWEIQQLEAQKQKLPQQLARQQERIDKAKAKLAQLQEEGKKMQAHLREQENQLATLESNIAKKQLQLNDSKNNKEYTALVEEIKGKKDEKGILEEAALKAMESIEQHNQAAKEQQKKIDDLKVEHQQFAKEAQVSIQEIDQQVAELEVKRLQKREEVANLDRATLELYERVAGTKTGKAMVPVADDACGFCYRQLLRNETASLEGGKTVFCKTCGRLLYLPGLV